MFALDTPVAPYHPPLSPSLPTFPMDCFPSPILSSIALCILGTLFPAALFRSYRIFFNRGFTFALLKFASLLKLPTNFVTKLKFPFVSTDDSVSTCANASFVSSVISASEENAQRQISTLERVFNFFDENGDGFVSTNEVGKVLEKLGICIADKQLGAILNSASGGDGDGNLQFEELKNLYESVQFGDDADCAKDNVESEEMWEAFGVFDKDADGLISTAELQRVLMSLGLKEGEESWACEEMIRRVDTNCDGRIDFSEFKQMMSR